MHSLVARPKRLLLLPLSYPELSSIKFLHKNKVSQSKERLKIRNEGTNYCTQQSAPSLNQNLYSIFAIKCLGNSGKTITDPNKLGKFDLKYRSSVRFLPVTLISQFSVS